MPSTSTRLTGRPTRMALSSWRDPVVVVLLVGAVLLTAAWGALLLRADVPLRLAGGPGPLTGPLDLRLGPWLVAPGAVAGLAVLRWPRVFRCAAPAALPWLAGVLAAVWAAALAVGDGPGGLTAALRSPHDYRADLDRVGGVGDLLAGFTAGIVRTGDGSEWATHVSAHPPGALLVVALPERLGLHGAGGTAGLCLLGAAVAVGATVATVREVVGPGAARRLALLLPLGPAALWSVTLDAVFAGVAAAGVLLLALARDGRSRRQALSAGAGGFVLGAGVMLSYGLVLLGPLALAVLLRRGRAAAVRLAPPAALGALALPAAAWGAGFAWWEGLALTRERMYQGVAAGRPGTYFVVANLVALAVVLGPAGLAGLARLRTPRSSRTAGAVLLLVGPVLLAVLAADVSGLSKGEVERVWLPFAPWLSVALVLLPVQHGKRWLAVQALTAILVGACVRSPW